MKWSWKLIINKWNSIAIKDKYPNLKNSLVKSKNTKPEIIVRKYLFNKGFRYRVNVKDILGSPDIVLKKYNTIIFVNGCFCHGHKDIECKEYKIPQKILNGGLIR